MQNYFTTKELECKCCHQCHMDEDFLFLLNGARQNAAFPWIVNSGYRCPKHNKDVGSKTQNHVLGRAVDIACTLSTERYRIVQACTLYGIFGIGVHLGFIHLDTNHDKPTLFIYTS